MMMDQLALRANNSPVCVGLDTQASFLPEYLQKKDLSLGEKFFLFNQKIIDATIEDAACFKIQIACYEALGMDGLNAFQKTLAYIRKKGGIAISDVKRGDISSTAQLYAKGHFEGDFETDFVTLNAYMGEDAISPYYPYFEQGKGAFLLVKTSNPSSKDFQDVLAPDIPLYLRMASMVSKWGEQFRTNGFSAIGAVVGLTWPKEFLTIKEYMPHTFFLIPGYGAQGGTGKDIAEVFKDGICGVVNSSRGLICAYKEKTQGEDFDLYVHDAAIAMKKDILQWL